MQNAAISLALLLFHAVIQPYENRHINVLDTFMYTDMVLINLISLYSLYAIQHSGVIHPTTLYILLLLLYAPMGISQDELFSALHMPSESTLGVKTLSSTDRFLVVYNSDL